VVEWHRPDRVLRQFGLHQTIPAPCDNEKALHAIDKRGKSEYDWSARHSRHIGLWEARVSSVVSGEPECSPMDYNDPYMEWYRRITRRIISPMNERRPGQFLPTGFAFQVLVSYYVQHQNFYGFSAYLNLITQYKNYRFRGLQPFMLDLGLHLRRNLLLAPRGKHYKISLICVQAPFNSMRL